MARQINILVGNGVTERDKDLFFGPISEEDEWFLFDDSINWPTIMAETKLFRSKGQARKNGWNKNVEKGFNNFRFGKLKHQVSILKIVD